MKSKKHTLLGAEVVRICKDKKHVDCYDNVIYMLFSNGFIIKMVLQDFYSYHDCDPTARCISIQYDPQRCKDMQNDKDNYVDIEVNKHTTCF